MMRYCYLLLLAACALRPALVLGQDPQFSQSYAVPLYVDPALAGHTPRERAVLNCRLQWPGLHPGFETVMASFDRASRKQPHGMGAYVMQDRTAGLKRTALGAAYSHHVRVNRRLTARAGLQLGLGALGQAQSYLFGDQLLRDDAPTSVETGIVQRQRWFDAGAGALLHDERSWAGLAAHHINRPRAGLRMDPEARMPVRWTVHGGHARPLDRMRLERSTSVLTLVALYKQQGTWNQFDAGGYVQHGKLTAGCWYRGLPLLRNEPRGTNGSESLVALLGITTTGGLRVAYSYDMTLSRLGNRPGGAHEIALVHEWSRRQPAKRHAMVPCPKF